MIGALFFPGGARPIIPIPWAWHGMRKESMVKDEREVVY